MSLSIGARPSFKAVACLAVLGAGAGISPLFSAYYSNSVWMPLGLGLTVVAAAAVIARPPVVTLPAVLATAGLAGLALWSLLSSTWAHAVELATVQANLWFTYAALMLLLLVLLRSDVEDAALLTAIGAGIAIVAASVVVRMFGSTPAALFLGGRLNAPLGYVNGEACVFAMGCWAGLALAERREPLAAAIGAAATVILACLTLLSQSRGAALALAVSVVIVLTVIPGVRRRLLALAAVAGGVALAAGPVGAVYSKGQAGAPPSGAVHSAVLAILAASAGVGAVWGLLVAVERALSDRGERLAELARRGATIAAVLVVLVPVGVGVVRASSIEHTLSGQWRAFVHLADRRGASGASGYGAQTRLLSGAGHRYDYWRIAWHAFLDHPVAGVGAGNYAESYFRNRRTTESVQNPHSIELQTLSELGVIGCVPLAMLLAGVALGVRRLRPGARSSPAVRTTTLAATGVAVVWLIDTSGDWMHLLPGIAAIGLAAIAVLIRGAKPARRGPSPLHVAGTGAIAFVLAIGGASLLRTGLAQRYLDDARAELSKHPSSAINDAGHALQLDSSNLDAYYVSAAGLARLHQAAAARTIMLAAAAEDRTSFVTWALLGDLEVRVGDLRAARTYYGRAHVLDPNDPVVAVLAAHPASALTGLRGR